MNPRMAASLDLPPPYHAIVLREHRDALAHASAIAGIEGAGTLVLVRRFDTIEMAVVLEPEEPLATARRALYAVMNAAGEALAAHCPPERPLAFAWPDTLLLDGGIVGGVRLRWPEAAAEAEPPPWLAAGVMLRLAYPLARPGGGASGSPAGEASAGRVPPGSHPLDLVAVRGTSLEVEGFEMLDAEALVGSIARHLMVQVDRWQEAGFRPVGEQFLARLPDAGGVRRRIDGNGDLLEQRLGGGLARHVLTDALCAPQWLDPATGEPWT